MSNSNLRRHRRLLLLLLLLLQQHLDDVTSISEVTSAFVGQLRHWWTTVSP
jgi:hypothetical protein